MIAYRLVNEAYDSVIPGGLLKRTSDNSNQKFGPGTYFFLDRDDAFQFLQSKSGYSYTHLIKCDIEGCDRERFVDLIAQPNLISRWRNVRNISSIRKATPEYCREHNFYGIIISLQRWRELMLLEEFTNTPIHILEAERLS